MTEHKKLARVTSVCLGIEDHGILTCMVMLDGGGWGQGFGGFALDGPGKPERRGSAAGCDWLRRLCAFFDAEDIFKDAVGRHVYAIYDEPFGMIVGLQRTEPEGGKTFLIADWKAAWEVQP